MKHHNFYVYIMSNEWLTIYVGVTNSLERRVYQHKAGELAGFTKRHAINRLVCFEHFTDIRFAIAREKEIKGWKRFKKVNLIRAQNPDWKDLSLEWNARSDEAECHPERSEGSSCGDRSSQDDPSLRSG